MSYVLLLFRLSAHIPPRASASSGTIRSTILHEDSTSGSVPITFIGKRPGIAFAHPKRIDEAPKSARPTLSAHPRDALTHTRLSCPGIACLPLRLGTCERTATADVFRYSTARLAVESLIQKHKRCCSRAQAQGQVARIGNTEPTDARMMRWRATSCKEQAPWTSDIRESETAVVALRCQVGSEVRLPTALPMRHAVDAGMRRTELGETHRPETL
jgi:hypothetical protein